MNVIYNLNSRQKSECKLAILKLFILIYCTYFDSYKSYILFYRLICEMCIKHFTMMMENRSSGKGMPVALNMKELRYVCFSAIGVCSFTWVWRRNLSLCPASGLNKIRQAALLGHCVVYPQLQRRLRKSYVEWFFKSYFWGAAMPVPLISSFLLKGKYVST